jgi:hypothetical protein
MLDWAARIDDLAFHSAAHYRIENRQALEILLSALVDCPCTAPVWLILETNWYSRDCRPAWFSFGGCWAPESLPALRVLRSRDFNKLVGCWLDDRSPHLFVECDFDGRVPRYRRLSDFRSLLIRTLRLRVVSASHGAAAPVDQRSDQQRADQLRALASAVLEDRVAARPPNPPAWIELPDFLYRVEVAVRLAGRHRDYGATAGALRALAVRRAYLFGRAQVDETDTAIVERALSDLVPPWVRRIVERLSASPNHKAPAQTLERIMRLEGPQHELARLHIMGILTWHQKQIWGLDLRHAPALAGLTGNRALQPAVRAHAG